MIARGQALTCRVSLALICLFSTASCGSPEPLTLAMGPGGVLEVLAPSPALERQVASGSLLVTPHPRAGALQLTRFMGREALLIDGAGSRFAIGRSVDAVMTATPFVEWSWAAEPFDADRLPIAIAIGVNDSFSQDGRNDLADAVFGIDLEPVDHLVVCTWERSALRRGTLDLSRRDQGIIG